MASNTNYWSAGLLERVLFIGGAYRSGTTLLVHLLDGHPDLVVFPTENCVIRDLIAFSKLPNPKQRSIVPLLVLLRRRRFEDALEYVLCHEILGQPLSKEIRLSGWSGNQEFETEFDLEKFESAWLHCFRALPDDIEIDAKVLFGIYTLCYVQARGVEHRLRGSAYLVCKCPDCGYCADYYLSEFPSAKVIQIVRDPRDILSSHKRGNKEPVKGYYRLFGKQLSAIKNTLRQSAQNNGNPDFLTVRYEDLIEDLEGTTGEICKFLNIRYWDGLTAPTIDGVPWKSNSTFSSVGEETAVFQLEKEGWQKVLNRVEVQLIEAEVGDLMGRFGYSRSLRASKTIVAGFDYALRAAPYFGARKVNREFHRIVRFGR